MKKYILILVAILMQLFANAQFYTWAKAIIGDPGNSDYGVAIVTDTAGNVYIGGFGHSMNNDFDPGPGTATVSFISEDIYFAKYDANGNFLWVKTIGGSYNGDNLHSMAIDNAANIYITGNFFGTNIDFDPGPGTALLTATNNSIFFAKYDSNGNYLWAKAVGGASGSARSINIDNATGNIYVTGYFSGIGADFDPGPGTATLSSAGSNDVFFAKYDANGNYLWAKAMGSVGWGWNAGYSIATDMVGNVLVTGTFSGTVDFDPGPGTATYSALGYDVFFAKYDTSGNYLWAKAISGNGFNEVGFNIATDTANNVYVSGSFESTNADFDPGPGTATLSSAGSADIFFAKYDANGNYLWAKNIGGSGSDYANSMVIDVAGYLYLTGSFVGTNIDFDPGPGAATLSSGSGSAGDIFLAKYDNNGIYQWAGGMTSGGNGSNANHINYGRGVTVDVLGNVYLTGIIQNGFYVTTTITVDFDPGPGTATLSAAQQAQDIFFAKYAQSCTTPTSIGITSATICFGQVATLTPSGAYSYSVNGTANSTFTFNPVNTTTYVVTASNYSCVASNSVTATISVNATPTITATNATICSGSSIIITPTGGVAAYTITGNNFTVSPNVTTSYSVTGTATNGCVGLTTVTVSVNNTPTIAITSETICSGNIATLVPSGANTYTITGGTFTVNPTSNTSYSVIGTATNGCTSSNTAVAIVSVNTTPTVSVNNETMCSGNSVTLVPSGASSYTITGNNFTVSPNTTSSYSVTGTATNGCVSLNTAVVTVSVNTTPTVSVNNATMCLGNSVTLVPSGASSYTITGNNFIVSPNITSSYSVTGTATNGCISGNTAVATVSVNDLPTINISGNSTICVNETCTLTAGGANSYTWNNNQNDVSITVTPSVTTSYSVQGTDTNGCVGSANYMINVNDLPSIDVIGSSTICLNEPQTLSANGANSYTWSTNENSASINVSPSVTTTYSVQGIDDNGCVGNALATVFVDECLGVGEIKTENKKLKIYPNPTNEILNVEWKMLNEKTEIEIKVIDVLGNTVIHNSSFITHNSARVDVSELKRGIYFIKVGNEVRKFVKE
ncbi:MAG: SBBP repeat-containing protein [Bacteroidetes bacterium]|nr:SBBP repeat-containing protein [Bacteroidota bacterium]